MEKCYIGNGHYVSFEMCEESIITIWDEECKSIKAVTIDLNMLKSLNAFIDKEKEKAGLK